MLGISVIMLYPIFRAIELSFYRAELMGTGIGAQFVGLNNYLLMLSDSGFWSSIYLTFVYTVGTVVGAYVVGLYTAMLVNRPFPGRALARAIIILPWAVPDLAAVLSFRWIFDPQYGILNYTLSLLGVMTTSKTWLSDHSLALPAVLVVTIWKWFPFSSLMLLAGLQTIPNELYEAAAIDGANAADRFLHVTIPGLKSINTILFLLLTIWSFGNFVIIYVLTAGGPARSTETIAIQLYLRAFKFSQVGYAATLGVAILVAAVVFSVAYFRVAVREERLL